MSPPMRVSRKMTRDWLWFAPSAPCPLISIRFIASESGVWKWKTLSLAVTVRSGRLLSFSETSREPAPPV